MTEEEKKEEKPKQADVECDVNTMNCTEMPQVMESLMRKEYRLNEGIKKIDELRNMFPNREELKKLQDDAQVAKETIHGTISDITTRFSMCSLRTPEEEQEPEETVETEVEESSDSNEE